MNPAEVFDVWAPAESVWSPWAKPVIFTAFEDGRRFDDADGGDPPAPHVASWAPEATARAAVVIDLEGADAVGVGIALARRGWRPVPLFNGCHGPAAAIDVRPVVRALVAGIADLAESRLPADAPPAFLLDARRTDAAPGPGAFDNRWVVLPQDFPSATFLLAHGVRGAVLVQSRLSAPRSDLAHVLLRWQEAGIAVSAIDLAAPGGPPRPIVVERPSRFRSALHALLVTAGLRRSSVGGFGALIPVPPPPGSVGYGHFG